MDMDKDLDLDADIHQGGLRYGFDPRCLLRLRADVPGRVTWERWWRHVKYT